MSELMNPLAEFVCNTTFADLPPALVARTKRHILDTFGATLAGSGSPIARSVQQLAAVEGAAGQAAVWGCSLATSPRNAAWLNGVAAHMYELDDTGGCDHSGAVVLPAVMAALALCPGAVSGQRLLVAVVVGYDVGRRVLEACGGYAAHNEAGWHSTASCGVFGAAAAVASLLRLDRPQTIAALGIAASFSGGLWGFINDGTQSKKLHAGRAAEGGLLAAQLAASGISGPACTFDDVWGGFLKTFAPHSRIPTALTADLGRVWKLNRCSIKPYASCRSTHSAIDAVGLLMQQHALEAVGVDAIEVQLNPFLLDMCGTRDRTSLASAQMSLPYALAARVLLGHAGLSAWDKPFRMSAELAAMMARVTLHIDAQYSNDDEPLVTVVTRDGARHSMQVTLPLGGPENPLSDALLEDKYRQLAQRVLPAAQCAALLAVCHLLEQQSDVKPMLALLSAS